VEGIKDEISEIQVQEEQKNSNCRWEEVNDLRKQIHNNNSHIRLTLSSIGSNILRLHFVISLR
jgi:hypothetical protein